MNFLTVKDRMVQATAKAASAAKNFKGLDQMAENDEYVNSEGLNVKRREHSSDANKRRQPTSSAKSQHSTEIEMKPGEDGDRGLQNSYVLDAVAEVIAKNSSSGQSKTQSLHKNNPRYTNGAKAPAPLATRKPQVQKPMNIKDIYESDDESVDSIYDDYDAENNLNLHPNNTIMHHYPGKISMQKFSNNPTNREKMSTNLSANTKRKNSKDPNRFMADLDARLQSDSPIQSQVDEESQNVQNLTSPSSRMLSSSHNHEGQQTQTQSPLNLFQSFVKSPQKLDWLREVTPRKIQESVSHIMPSAQQTNAFGKEREPLCKAENSSTARKLRFGDGEVDDEDVNKVQSSALIGDNESEELMRIRQKMNAGVIATALELLEKHRHYLWIAVMFIVSTWFYFGARRNNINPGTEDTV
jgi:hypothetical protein